MSKSRKMSESEMQYIVLRLLERAKQASDKSKRDRTDMLQAGRSLAYYEMMDILKSELIVSDQDLKKYGLEIDLEKELV